MFSNRHNDSSPSDDRGAALPSLNLSDGSFLDDPAFVSLVNNRVERVMIQSLGGSPIELAPVEPEVGAKILAFYVLRKHDIVINDPERFVGRHDVKGGPVWEAADPLYADAGAVVASISLVQALTGGVTRGNDPTLLFTSREVLNNRENALALLAVDGFNWIYLSDARKGEIDMAFAAVRNSKSVFEYIVKDPASPPITRELAQLAVEQDGRLLRSVPPELVDDPMITASVKSAGGTHLAFAARICGVHVWDNRERTLEAIEKYPPLIAAAPAVYLGDPRCRTILIAAARNEIMVVSNFPETLQIDPEFVPVIVENMDKRPNLYGWLAESAQNHPDIKARHLALSGGTAL